METIDFDKKSKELKKALRRQLKAIKVEENKFLVLDLLYDFIDMTYNISLLEKPCQRRFNMMTGSLTEFLSYGLEMKKDGSDLRKLFHDEALSIANALTDEFSHGKL